MRKCLLFRSRFRYSVISQKLSPSFHYSIVPVMKKTLLRVRKCLLFQSKFRYSVISQTIKPIIPLFHCSSHEKNIITCEKMPVIPEQISLFRYFPKIKPIIPLFQHKNVRYSDSIVPFHFHINEIKIYILAKGQSQTEGTYSPIHHTCMQGVFFFVFCFFFFRLICSFS